MRITLLLITFLATITSILTAQNEKANEISSPPIPAEVFFGNEYFNFQMITAKPLSKSGKLGFFNVTTFNGSYKNDLVKNEFLSQALLNYSIFKGLAITGGVSINHVTGFRPTLGLQYLYANQNWLAILLPRVDLTQDNNIDVFSLVQYSPSNKKVNPYIRIQGLYNQNPTTNFHDRSYAYFRAGVSIKKIQFGLGANLDWYGPIKVHTQNYGGFFRVLIR